LDPEELIHPRSSISKSTKLELRKTEHVFLLQSKWSNTLRNWIDAQKDFSAFVRSIALKWLDEGLKDRCISRDLKWGVSIPLKGLEHKVFYVWFDAPIAYIAATKAWADQNPVKRDWKSWWLTDTPEDVYYVQFMAKDNIPFHSITFPTTLMASQMNWKQVDFIKGFNWLTYYGKKFSTSAGFGVFMDQALDVFPAEYYRYWLLANAPEGSDAAFTWEQFIQTINKDLCGLLGNFVNRVLRFAQTHFGQAVPPSCAWEPQDLAMAQTLDAYIDLYQSHLKAMNFRKAIAQLRGIWSLCNEYITQEAPWTCLKSNPERAATLIAISINLIAIVAQLAWPILPKSCEAILTKLNASNLLGLWPKHPMHNALTQFASGHPIEIIDLLFEKIPNEILPALTQRFGAS
jgi:methionyl-tRNA synthetase